MRLESKLKSVAKVVLLPFLCCIPLQVAAEQYPVNNGSFNNTSSPNPWKDPSQDLAKFLKNLGAFLGYDITKSPQEGSGPISQNLINLSFTSFAQTSNFYTFLGALPLATQAAGATPPMIVPSSVAGAETINKQANLIFSNPQYSSASVSTVSVNDLIDQQTYQSDPLSQSVLNLLLTPSHSFQNLAADAEIDKNLLFQNDVMKNVIGDLPKVPTLFSYNYNQQLISQLNSNSLIGPLLYSTKVAEQNRGSPTPNNSNPGLRALNQMQEAANFIRYATGLVTPPNLPNAADYQNLYNKAVPVSSSPISPQEQTEAQNTLNTYLTNLRVYAAQSSIGIGNLYYILSKRMPQNTGTETSPILTSQAVSEFNMATWRLYNSNMTKNVQWIESLNGATSATVQKEIATLLAEINYQMYLDRQIQERILLNNSIMLMQNTKSNQPSPDFANQPNSASK